MSEAESDAEDLRAELRQAWWERRRDLDAREPLVENPTSSVSWIHLLIGPTVWMTYFFVVYLLAEYVCAGVVYDTVNAVGESTMVVLVILTTAVAMGICAWAAWRSAGEINSEENSFVARAGMVLSVGSAASVLIVGLPALWIGPC